MPLLDEPVNGQGSKSSLIVWPMLIGLVLLSLWVYNLSRTEKQPLGPAHVPSRMETIAKSGVIRAGYGGFPPYTKENPNASSPDEKVSGFSIDVVNEIARRSTPPLKVQWVRLNWDTLKADVLSNKFDFVADPVFQTIPRAMDFGLAEPYSYFGIAVAVVRKDDNRFNTFADLDQPGITIALAQGWTSSEYARKNLSKPTMKDIPVTGDAFNQLDEVMLGRADVALNDVPTVAQYVKAHGDKVKALWLDHPPSSVPGSFLTRREDTDVRAFLDESVRVLVADGFLDKLDQKWKTYGFIPKLDVASGRGLAK